MNDEYDVAVLGGGTGGYAAAFRARELGLKTIIIERDKLGGTCLHRGCVPTKSLLRTAELLETFKIAPKFGIHFSGQSIAWDEVIKAKDDVVAEIYAGLRSLAKNRGLEIATGEGQLGLGDYVEVVSETGRRRLSFKHLILATGSRPKTVSNVRRDGQAVITSEEALGMTEVPASIIILGGGYVGVEFASLWRSFGAEVTIVEMASRLLVQEEVEISNLLAGALRDRGIRILLEAKIKSVTRNEQLKTEVVVNDKSEFIEAEKIMVAVGREAVVDGLKEAAIAIENGCVKVDGHLRTSRKNIYAVGDLLPTPQLAHAAFAEGIYAVEDLAGQDPEPIDYDALPRCVYSYPEVAGVGLTEETAKKRGLNTKVARASFEINSKARIAGEPMGEAKVISENGGGILGIHMIGPKVTETISEAMLVTGWEATPEEVAKLIHPHPTFSEMIGETSLKLAGKPLHVL